MLTEHDWVTLDKVKHAWRITVKSRVLTIRQPTPEDIPMVKAAIDKCGEHTRKHYVGPGWWTGYDRICREPAWEFNHKKPLSLIGIYNGEVVGLMHIRFKPAPDMPQAFCKTLGDRLVTSSGFCIIDPFQYQGFGKIFGIARENISVIFGADWIVGETYKGSGMEITNSRIGWEIYNEWTLGSGETRIFQGKDLRDQGAVFDFNIFSGIKNGADPNGFSSFNQAVAWGLKQGLDKHGKVSNFVDMHQFRSGDIPRARHAIVTAAAVTNEFRRNEKLLETVRGATDGHVCMYLDSDLPGYEKMYDRIFTVVRPKETSPPEFVYAGWGANRDMFYPEQTNPALFLDTFVQSPKHSICKDAYRIYDEVAKELPNSPNPVEVIRPFRYYRRQKRMPWPEMAGLLRRSTYYCCTIHGESGLPRLEAATSGALLVVPKILYMDRTMGSLEHRIWETKDELMDILSTPVDHKKCRRKALKHSWEKTVGRILEELK